MDYGALKSHVFLWLSSILDHLVTLVTGGVVIAALWFLEAKYSPKYRRFFEWYWKRYLFLCFICFAVFQSWEGEYVSRIGREKDLLDANTAKAYAISERASAERNVYTCQDALRLSAENEGKALGQSMEALGQTQASQSKVQECLLALGKAQQLEPAKIITTLSYLPWVSARTQPQRLVAVIVGQSNRRVSSSTLVLTCSTPFRLIGATVPQAAQFSQVTNNQAHQLTSVSASISVTIPPLEVNRPVLFWVEADSFQGCEVKQQPL